MIFQKSQVILGKSPMIFCVKKKSLILEITGDFSKSRQRRETTICRATALHPLRYENIIYVPLFEAIIAALLPLWALMWNNGSKFTLSEIGNATIWICSMSHIDALTFQSGTKRNEYCVKHVFCKKIVYVIDTDILNFPFLDSSLWDTCKWRSIAQFFMF